MQTFHSFLTNIDNNFHHDYINDASNGHHHHHDDNNDEIKIEINEHEQRNSTVVDNGPIVDAVDSLLENVRNLEIIVEPEQLHTVVAPQQHHSVGEIKFEREQIEEIHSHRRHYHVHPPTTLFCAPAMAVVATPPMKKSQPINHHFPHSKQHTGLKNISFNVGAAVSPTDKMEFDQEKPESFGVLKINRPIGMEHHAIVDAIGPHTNLSNGSTEGFTDQGYFDLKFHHNRLW